MGERKLQETKRIYKYPAQNDVYDLTIIGGGPCGLYGAYYAGLRGARTKIIDCLPQLGGQLSAMYPDKYIYDVPGFPKILAKELVANLVDQAMYYDITVCLEEKAIGLVAHVDGTYKLITDKDEHLTRTLLLAVGMGAFVPKKLDVPNLQELEGRGVYYFVTDEEIFRNKNIVIVGGGDSAVDWALNLHPIARKVTLVHRRDRFRAHEGSVANLKKSPVDLKLFYELKRVHGKERVGGVTILHNKAKEEKYLPANALLLNIGFLANLEPIQNWGLKIDGNAVFVNSTMETNLPGVYAAGDITNYSGKLKLISTGQGEAAIATNNAKIYLDPRASYFPGHTSSMYIKR